MLRRRIGCTIFHPRRSSCESRMQRKAWRMRFVRTRRTIGTVREAAKGSAGGMQRSNAGASRAKKLQSLLRGREMIETIRQGLKENGFAVSISQLRRWFEVPRRTVYYHPFWKAPVVQQRFSVPIKQMIEKNPSFGYRTVAHLLNFNKNTVQRIFQMMRWQVKKRPGGLQASSRGMPSVGASPNERWSTSLYRMWSRRDGWAPLALVMDCHSRELLAWNLSGSKTAKSALKQALIARFGTPGRLPREFLLRSDNGLVFTSRSYTKLVRGYGLRREFIGPYTPEQNGIIERLIRTLKEQRVHRHHFETCSTAAASLATGWDSTTPGGRC